MDLISKFCEMTFEAFQKSNENKMLQPVQSSLKVLEEMALVGSFVVGTIHLLGGHGHP